MKYTRLPAIALSVAVSTAIVAAPAEAQPAAPSIQQLQKQFDDAVRDALMSLWAPYDQLVRTFPQLKPLLDPVVNQFLPARKPVTARPTTADSLFAAINEGVAAYNRNITPGIGTTSPSPMKRSPQLDAMAQRIADEAVNGNANLDGFINRYPTPAPFEFHGALWETSDKPRSETEEKLRAGEKEYISAGGYHWHYAGTAVAERNGKYAFTVVYGGKSEYGIEDL